jgi:lipid A 3-O-deacylase
MLRLATSASALALLTGVAVATEGPLANPPPPMLSPAPIAFNWSGFYFGGHGGWGLASGAFSDGAVVGGQVGVNWQYGHFVVGFEGGGSWVDWGSINSVETALGRGGYAFNRILVYGAGGLAVEDFKALVGWVAGGGVEYAFADNWTAGVEYLHYDFADDESEVIRGRVNYLFGDASRRPVDDFSHGGIFDEVRLGALVFWQNNASTEQGLYATGQVLFDPFVRRFDNWALNVLLRPRPHIGGNVSPDGTDQIFAGLTWHVPVGQTFFAEASFGGTVHNGPIKNAQVSLGCHTLFRESIAAGINIREHWRVIAGIDHSSHAELCSPQNDGLTHVGASIGYRF